MDMSAALLDLPAIADGPQSAEHPGRQTSLPRIVGGGHRHAGRSMWHKGWVDLEFDPSRGSIWKTRIHGKATSLACEPRRGRR